MSGGYVATGKGIGLHQMLVLKHAVKLESLGMRHSSGRRASMIAKESLGLSRNTKLEVVIEKLEEKIEELKVIVQEEGGIRTL